jgi:hypothetical protein
VTISDATPAKISKDQVHVEQSEFLELLLR